MYKRASQCQGLGFKWDLLMDLNCPFCPGASERFARRKTSRTHTRSLLPQRVGAQLGPRAAFDGQEKAERKCQAKPD